MFNPQGTLHGGIIATAMDVSMGHLLHYTTGSGATLEMNVKYLLPIKEEEIVCKGSYLKRGKTIVFLQSHLFREDGKLAAYASATWIPINKKAKILDYDLFISQYSTAVILKYSVFS